MELFQLDHFTGLRGLLMVFWLVFLVLGVFLIISGFKADKLAVKITTISLGSILSIAMLYLLLYTLVFGFNS